MLVFQVGAQKSKQADLDLPNVRPVNAKKDNEALLLIKEANNLTSRNYDPETWRFAEEQLQKAMKTAPWREAEVKKGLYNLYISEGNYFLRGVESGLGDLELAEKAHRKAMENTDLLGRTFVCITLAVKFKQSMEFWFKQDHNKSALPAERAERAYEKAKDYVRQVGHEYDQTELYDEVWRAHDKALKASGLTYAKDVRR
jgi:hypothetical protein